jgi:AcrR family transcriptional regulator
VAPARKSTKTVDARKAPAKARTEARVEAPRKPAPARPSRLVASKRERNNIRNREQIVAAARESFCEVGFGAATVRDIMRRSGLASGTFYNYFDDKESVLREIVLSFAAKVRERVHEARMEAGTLEDLIRSAFHASFTAYSQDRLLVTLVARNAGEVHELIAANVMDPAIRDLAEDLKARSGEFGITGLDLDGFAHAGVALASEFGYRLIQTRPLDIEGTTDFVTDIMLGGIERMSAKRA